MTRLNSRFLYLLFICLEPLVIIGVMSSDLVSALIVGTGVAALNFIAVRKAIGGSRPETRRIVVDGLVNAASAALACFILLIVETAIYWQKMPSGRQAYWAAFTAGVLSAAILINRSVLIAGCVIFDWLDKFRAGRS